MLNTPYVVRAILTRKESQPILGSVLTYSGRLIVLIWALFGIIASAATIVSVGNPDPDFTPGLLLNEQEALSVSWTQTKSYTSVSIYAPLGQGAANDANPVYAYLTDRVGLGTTEANEIAKSVVYFSPATDPTVQLFSNLSLGPGTYYVTLWSPVMAGGGWAFATDPSVTLDEGVMVGASQYAYQYVGLDKLPFGFPSPPSGLYIPAGISIDTYPNEHLVFSVKGTATTAVPEPTSISRAGIAAVMLGLMLCKIRARRAARL